MMCKAVVGMAFGDEGKGSFTDFLASEAQTPLMVKCCGGAQASHSVVLPDESVFRFSQLSSGMTSPGASTYLSDNFVINPFSLAEECRTFSGHMGISRHEIMRNVFLDCRSPTVTRFHRAINRLEMERTGMLRGSVGTGVSTAAIMARQDLPTMRVSDIFSDKRREILLELQDFLTEYYNESFVNRKEIHEEIKHLLMPSSVQRLENEYGELCDDFAFQLCEGIPNNGRDIICEGSQGFLLDYRYGTLPNVTGLDTSTEWIRKHFQTHKIFGAVRSFWSRHGPGAFPSESENLRPFFRFDEQEIGKYNGRIRYGYFDLVLFRYSVMLNAPDALAMSFADLMEKFKQIPVCDKYKCDSAFDLDLNSYFETDMENGQLVIKNIKSLCAEACSVLKSCIPVMTYISTPSDFIRFIEKESGINVELISYGPGRERKRWVFL